VIINPGYESPSHAPRTTREAGVCLEKSRFGYGSALGEGISRDPSGESIGPDLYSYVDEDPINQYDPSGLAGIPATDSVDAQPGIAAQAIADSIANAAAADLAPPIDCPKGKKKDPCKGLADQLAAHQKKLADYMANPDAFDNLGFLKNATLLNRWAIINGRIRNLRKQIENFQKQLDECRKSNPGSGS
jgi:RHS repeat-associated protein